MTGANTGYISSLPDLERLAAKVVSDGLPIALDCETGYDGEDRAYKNTSPSLHPEENVLAGFSFTNAVGWARYVPVGHEEARYNIEPRGAALQLWNLVQTGLAVVHNADLDARTLSRFIYRHLADHPIVGAAVRACRGYFPIRSDTMMECHALARWESIALKALSWEVFAYKQTELIELFNEVVYGVQGKKLPQNKRHTLRFNVLDPSDPRVYGYACDDVIRTLMLHERHYPLVEGPPTGPGPQLIYWIEMNNWPIVWATEDEGLVVDWDFLDEAKLRARQFQIKMQSGMLSHLTERLNRVPTFKGKPFNPNSFPQLGSILYSPAPEGLGLRTHIMTAGKPDGTGKKMSTKAIALKGISTDPFVRRLQDYRGLTKLLGTYLETFRREFGWSQDGRAHCHLLPHGTLTGRFSSADFNYQNLPKKYHYAVDDATFDLNFRDCVVVPDGWWGIGFDISQGELRIIAAEAGETAMLEAFERGDDLHALTAGKLLGLTPEEVRIGGELAGVKYPEEKGGFRPFGKTMNFALGYQLTVQGLADRLACSLADAEMHFNNYFSTYSMIAAWTRRTVAESKVTGYTSSRFGRRHPIWGYKSDKSWVYAGGERTAGNAPIQGGLADMMKLIMIRCDRALERAGLKDRVRLVMNVHDSLDYYAREDVPPQLIIDVLTPAIIEKTPWTQHWPVMVPEWHVWKKWGSQTELKLDGRYQIMGMGDIKVLELEEDSDDEDDGAGGVLPDAPAYASGGSGADAVGLGGRGYSPAVSADLAGVPGSSGTNLGDNGRSSRSHSGRVLVRVPEMPELASLRRFMEVLSEFPGPNELLLETPEGPVVLSTGTSMSPDDAGRISIMLGGAQVVWSAESVDNNALADGLAL